MRDKTTPSEPDSPVEGRWLAIESSGLYGSLALGELDDAGPRIIRAQQLPRDARSARTLAPAISQVLADLAWPPASIRGVVVTVGPGSFTGLRVGVTTAKTFAYSVGALLVGVDTLDALAEGAAPPVNQESQIWPLLDAQRGEFFAAPFEAIEGRWGRAGETRRYQPEEILREITTADCVLGPTPLGDTEIPYQAAQPTAEAALRWAWRSWPAGLAASPFELAPRYHRASAAEEKLADR